MTITFGNIKPFSPSEAANAAGARIPDVVLEAVNAVLAKYAANRRVFSIAKSEIIDEIISRNPELNEDVLLNNRWLDFEPAYRQKGWKCDYETAEWGSSQGGRFNFEAK